MKRARRSCRALLVVLVAAVASSIAADPEVSFRKGIAARDFGRYDESAEWLRRAIDEDGRESEKKILISGVFFEPYLPHFQLGAVLLLAGEEHCDEALAAWAESKRQGVIGEFPRKEAELGASSARCRAAVLPARLEATESAIGWAAAAGEQLKEPFEAAGDETERRAARAQLELARRRLEQARSGDDPALAEEAEELAQQADERLRVLARKSAERRARDLESAAAASRRALVDLDEAKRSLADRLAEPELLEARRERPGDFGQLALPDGSDAALEDLRRRQRAAADAIAHREIESEAAAWTSRLDAIDRRARSALADLRSAPPRSNARPAAEPARADRATDRESPAILAPADPPPEIRVPAQAIDATLGSLLAASEALLARLDGAEGGPLREAQRTRLASLVAAVRDRADDTDLRHRLESSHAALQVIAGGEALIDGRAADALDILSARALPGDRIGSQGLLLRAVALHRLARTEDQRSKALLERATRDLGRFRALGGALDGRSGPPREAQVFSSDFWRFYDGVGAASAD